MQKIKKALLIVLALVMVTCGLIGCGQKEIDETLKYVIVSDNYGTEYLIDTYRETFKVPFVNEKSYRFTYQAFYDDNDEPTGEQGYFDLGLVYEPKEYVASCDLLYTRGFTFIFIIEELPLTELTIKLDARGAIRYVDKESYVYDYDTVGGKYPIASLYEGETLLEGYDDLIFYRFIRLETDSLVQSPKYIGFYDVEYRIGSFENKERTKKYKEVRIKFTIELIEV